MAAGLGFKTFTTGEVLTAADTNGYLMQGINVFANSAARAAAITSPQEGQYSYLKDTNALEYYDGAAWVGAPVGDITAVTAGKGLTGGGSSGDVTVSLATSAKGDLVVGTGTTTAAALTVGNNGETLVADSSQTVGLRYNPQNSKANCFINGGMDIWQRSTSASATQGYVAADRWITYTGTSGRTYSRQTGTAGIPYALRCQRDSGQTTTNGIAIGNAVEIADATPYQGKTVTISFYARAGANYSRSGSTLGYAVTTGTGTTEANGILSGYTGQSTATSGTVTLTTSFQRFAFSFTFGASITQFNIELSTNTLTGTAGANDWFEVTGVQMDLGTYTADTAPTFRRAGGTIQGELAACQRYLPAINTTSSGEIGIGMCNATTSALVYVGFPVPARVTPTGITTSAANTFTLRTSGGGGAGTPTTVTFNSASVAGCSFSVGGSSGLTAGNATSCLLNGQILFTGCEL